MNSTHSTDIMSFENPVLHEIMVHRVGIRDREEPLTVSHQPVQLPESIRQEMTDFFLKRFEFAYEQYRFDPAGDGVVRSCAERMLDEPAEIPSSSINLATRLYETLTHPRVKPGELVVVRFSNVRHEGQQANAIGIFKLENRTRFLEILDAEEKFAFSFRDGIDLVRPDKGCLILDLMRNDGFLVKITDPNNRGEEARYWKESFLGLSQRVTSYSQTNSLLATTKAFVSEGLDEDFEVAGPKKLEMLNRSMEWMQSQETFDRAQFEQDVFRDPEVIKSYQRFTSEKLGATDPAHDETFTISAPALKKQARVYKSVLKLDRNFHIYIHGNRELIERGQDPDGRRFYKIYFSEES